MQREDITVWCRDWFDKNKPSHRDDFDLPTMLADFHKHLSKNKNQGSFQSRTKLWTVSCFGEAVSNNAIERNHRFLEEALELVQTAGCTASEAHQLVDYVYSRPTGEMLQELGGVMVTLAALSNAWHIDMEKCAETELSRVWTKIEKIRAKQAAKPKHSPLPEAPL